MNSLSSLLCIFFLGLAGWGYGQQVDLKGQVSIHNSLYETGSIQYVPNAEIRASYTAPTSSDNNGNFALTFVSVSKGVSINLSIEKAGLEVVNARDLQDVVVGRRTRLKVFLAPVGQIDLARTELYNVSVEALTARHRATIAQLQKQGAESQAAIDQLEDKLNTTIANRYEAEVLLNKQLVATKQRLPEFARELATVNLDFASDMYRRAYEFFKAGEIEKAIEELDEAILDKEAEDAVNKLQQLEQDIINLDSAQSNERQRLDMTIRSMILECQVLQENSRLDEAIDNYELILDILEERQDTNQLPFAAIFWNLGEIYLQKGQPGMSLEYKEKHLRVTEDNDLKKTSDLVLLYQDIAQLSDSMRLMDKALIYQRKIFQTLLKIDPPDPDRLRQAKMKLSLLLAKLGSESETNLKLLKAKDFYEELLLLTPKDKEIKKNLRKLKKKIKKQ